MYKKSKHQKFFEEDITDFGKERLKRIAYYLVFCYPSSGYKEYIDDLQMAVVDGRIIVSGWTTQHRWRVFTQKMFENISYDRVYDQIIERCYKSMGYEE